MKKILLMCFLCFVLLLTVFSDETGDVSSATIGGTGEVSWSNGIAQWTPSILIEENKPLAFDNTSETVAENSVSGIGNSTIAQAHGVLLYSNDKAYSDVWDLVSVGTNGRFEFFKNVYTDTNGLQWESAGTYNPNVNHFNGYGTGIVGNFSNAETSDDKTVDYFGISETDRTNGVALYVKDVANTDNSRTQQSVSVSANSGTFVNEQGNPVNGTNGWTSTGIGKYDMNGDDFLELIYAVRGSVFIIENHNGDFMDENGDLNNHVLFDDPVLNNGNSVTNSSRGAAVCDVYDFNKDGIPDILAAHTDKKGLYIYLGEESEDSDYPVYEPDEKISIITSEGELAEGNSGKLFEDEDNQNLAITLLRVDENGILYVGTDSHRQSGDGGRVTMITLDTDNSTVRKPVFHAQQLLDQGGDFDHGSLGKFYPNKKDQMVIADGNNSGQFYVTRTEYENHYESRGKLITQPLSKIDALEITDEMYINEVTITLEISSEFKETLEASPTTPKAVLYLNVFKEKQEDQAAKHFLKNLYNPSYQMASEDIEEINGKYYVTKTFAFSPSPHPVVSLAFETNEAKPGYTPTINNMTIEVNKLWGEDLAAEIDLEIDNISW